MPSAAPLATLSRRRRLLIYVFMMLALFMATLDNQIVSTALPTIVAELGSIERFGWVSAAYLLAQSAIMPVYGKLGDLFGRKYVMMFAISLFVIGSLSCGLAWSMESLIAARVLQGLGGGGIMVSIFSINADLFAPRERAKYQSFSSLVLMASGSIGPTLGGLMSQYLGWRSIFLVNLPIGILVLTSIFFLLPYVRPNRQPKIDYAGATTLAITIGLIVLWADGSQIFGGMFTPVTFGILGLATVSAIVWVRIERRAPEPIIPLSLFNDKNFPLLLIVALTSGGVGIGLVNYHALFLQMTTGLSPAHAGLFFIAITGGIAVGSLTAGRLIARTGQYKPFLITGTTLSVLALIAVSQIQVGTSLWVVGIVLAVSGLAIGLAQQSPIIGVQLIAPQADIGAATSAVTLCRMAGASLAISTYGAVLSARLMAGGDGVIGVPDPSSLSPEALADLPDTSRIAVSILFSNAFTWLYMVAAGLSMIGLTAAILLRPTTMPVSEQSS
ncbi:MULTISPECIES: MDR family MFS transporter [Pacificibacter]|uniref:MDR family MFS transporter n=1 Tax=Pacificibacter TaxID=1042323 RepID=UPI0020904EBD|nr:MULTISPECIES: MDR family MFS transporter [Pacificibacter]MDO6614435.1 MDR family MFS transporter [Pacificibacter sp. 1_MG-2023]